MNNKAFTLVELIVVITILAILGTIAFISLQGYSRDARDSVRTTDLSNISKQLELMLVKAGKVYIPENKVDITASGTVILYQGNMGQDTLNKLRVYNGGLDPVDQTPYTYSTTKNLKQYELMGFLENGNKVALVFPQANAATNLKDRFPYVKGKNIGIFLDSVTKEPIQNTGTGIDIVNTTNTYTAYLDNSSSGSINGTGVLLKSKLFYVINPVGSCNSILKNGNSKGDGMYKINPTLTGSFEVYCDMTTDGGGYTRYLKIKSNYSFDDAKKCWLGERINNKTLECFNPNRFKMDIADKMMIKMGGIKYFYSPINKFYSVDTISTTINNYTCLGNKEYMTIMTTSGIPDSNLNNINYIYMGVNYCSNSLGIGGVSSYAYLNYSYMGVFGPQNIDLLSSREPNVIKSEIYIR